MDPREVKTAADARAIVEQRGLDYVKVGVFDVDGVMRGKYMGREKFFSALDHDFGFCDVVLGWDSNDQLYDNVKVTGWHTAYPDAQVRIVPDSCRNVPLEGDMLLFLGEFAGAGEAVCPRGVLRRVLDRAGGLGYGVRAAAEFEFFVFEETPHSVRKKHYRGLKTITPGYFGYSMLRSSVHADFYKELLDMCAAMDMPLEGMHTETGPGVL
jgi:glutamine synthetase